MRTREEVIHAFTPVGKLSQVQQMALAKMETSFKDLATDILKDVPECADRTSALRKCLEAKMMCSQAITHAAVGKTSNSKGDTNGKNETQNTEAQAQQNA